MATIKSYTDLEQSKKLVEILPLESADMYYDVDIYGVRTTPEVLITSVVRKKDVPCWSLAALLSVIPNPSLRKTFSGWRCDSYNKEGTSFILGEPSDNPVDACYEMILKLHEMNLL